MTYRIAHHKCVSTVLFSPHFGALTLAYLIAIRLDHLETAAWLHGVTNRLLGDRHRPARGREIIETAAARINDVVMLTKGEVAHFVHEG